MRILFYLPVITPWWFDAIIVPMLRTLHSETAPVDLHVMVAPLWRNTGIDADQLFAVADLPAIQWHIVDEGEPEQFRQDSTTVPGLLDRIAAIDPDVTLARSSDFAISRHFPGIVRFIMEGDAPPFASIMRGVVLEETPFAAAIVPASAAALADCYAERLQTIWELTERHAHIGTRTTLRERLGLPQDRPVLAVPLLYEHEENYFLDHAAYPDGIALIEALLATVDDGILLAIADHPLNAAQLPHPRRRNRAALEACLAPHRERMIDCTGSRATEMLAVAADAMVADLSKSWTLAAFHGAPLVDIARRPVAEWLNAVPGMAALPAALASGRLAAPDRAAARRWFGWHLGARIFRPGDLTAERLLRCIAHCPSESDIAGNLDMVLAQQQTRLADHMAAAA